MTISPGVGSAIARVLVLLDRGRYVELAQLTADRRLSAAMIRQAIEEYGRTLRMPPGNELPPDLDVIAEQKHPHRHHATMSLWTVEEGESDLSLLLTLVEQGSAVDVIVDGIYVM